MAEHGMQDETTEQPLRSLEEYGAPDGGATSAEPQDSSRSETAECGTRDGTTERPPHPLKKDEAPDGGAASAEPRDGDWIDDLLNAPRSVSFEGSVVLRRKSDEGLGQGHSSLPEDGFKLGHSSLPEDGFKPDEAEAEAKADADTEAKAVRVRAERSASIPGASIPGARKPPAHSRDHSSVTMHTVFPTRRAGHASVRLSQRPWLRERLSVQIKRDAERHGVKMQRDLDFQEYQRAPEQTGAMSGISRWSRAVGRFNAWRSPADVMTNEMPPDQQYRIPPPEDEDVNIFYGISAFFSLRFMDLVVWLFKTNYPNVLLVFSIIYVAIVNLFTTILYAIANRPHRDGVECISGWDYVGDGGGERLNWEIAFSLSWTTFSTVGFGTISPDIVAGCYGLRYACAIGAFLGVLYAGFCSAVFFAKFTRLLGRAHVIFSSTVVVQFGGGASGYDKEPFKGSPSDAPSSPIRRTSSFSQLPDVPFPVAEFRIVNTRANEKQCEIIDANISCLVCVNYSPESSSELYVSDDSAGKIVLDGTTGVNESVPLFKQKYHHLPCKASTHPYFKRIWYVRHVLDGNSPLVKPEMRSRISRCGQWPRDANNHEAVRNSLVPFSDIIVTLKGTSNLSASGVFAEKRYKYRDVHVGWQFAGMMYFGKKWGSEKKKMLVDKTLVHDILPQDGGGNEPIGILES